MHLGTVRQPKIKESTLANVQAKNIFLQKKQHWNTEQNLPVVLIFDLLPRILLKYILLQLSLAVLS